MKTVSRSAAAAIVSVFVFASVARADAFAVTGGSIMIPSVFGPATFALQGDGFSLMGSVAQGVGSLTCFPCSADAPVTIQGPLSDTTFGGSPGTFNGVSYPALFFAGVMNVSSPSFPGSDLLDSSAARVPFTFTGQLFGYATANDAFTGANQLFMTDLTGGGSVTARFTAVPVAPGQTPLFDFGGAQFAFDEVAPSATPEPATLVLFGIGAAAILRRRSQESKRK
jgi:hypothetical protein